jgi:hypothetical protein
VGITTCSSAGAASDGAASAGVASDGATVFYSKTAIQGYAPGFSAEFTMRVPPDYGRGVACASIATRNRVSRPKTGAAN